MKQKTLLFIAIFSCTLSAGAIVLSLYTVNSQKRFAYVDNARILTEFEGIKEGKAEYEQKVLIWNANLDTLEQDFKRDVAQFRRQLPKLSASEKESYTKALNKKQQDFLSYKKATETQAREEDKRLTEQVLNQVDSFVHDYGETHPYDFIIGITDAGNLMYAKEGSDITDEVLAHLNNQYRGVN